MFNHHAHTGTPQPPTDPTTALQEAITLAKTYKGDTDGPLNLHANERRFFTMDGAGLVEPRRAPNRRVGGYAGPSFRVAKGIYLHTGTFAAKSVPGKITPTVIDTDTAVVTDQRVTFMGTKATREFFWAKLLAFDHDLETRTTIFHMSGRQTPDAIHWGLADGFCFYCDLAHAHFAGTVDDFVNALEREETPADH
ncbi:MAG: hypothetical protein ACYDEP_06120 [Acidimicrobiales bacterium]